MSLFETAARQWSFQYRVFKFVEPDKELKLNKNSRDLKRKL